MRRLIFRGAAIVAVGVVALTAAFLEGGRAALGEFSPVWLSMPRGALGYLALFAITWLASAGILFALAIHPSGVRTHDEPEQNAATATIDPSACPLCGSTEHSATFHTRADGDS